MKKYYLLNCDDDINSICASFLDESCFQQSVTIVESNKSKKMFSAWEVSLEQLQQVYRAVRDKHISLKKFQVATNRTRHSDSLHIAQKKEYIEGHQSIHKRPKRLKQILAERKEKLRS
jgi:hypothetical protein